MNKHFLPLPSILLLFVIITVCNNPVRTIAYNISLVYLVELRSSSRPESSSFDINDALYARLERLLVLSPSLAVSRDRINYINGWLSWLRKDEQQTIDFWKNSNINVEMLIRFGINALDNQDFETAVYWYQLAGKIFTTSSLPAYYSALAYELNDDYETALQYYQRAVKINPAHFDAQYGAGDLALYKLNDSALAATFFQNALAVDPTSIMSHVSLGVAHDNLGKFDNAEKHFITAVDLGSTTKGNSTEEKRLIVWPYYRLGNFYHRHEMLAKAEDAYKKAISLDLDDIWSGWSYWGLGRIELKRERLSNARRMFQHSLELPIDRYVKSQSLLGIGQTYLVQNDYDSSIPYIKAAIDAQSTNLGLCILYGDTLLLAERFREAKQAYQNCLEQWPANSRALEGIEEIVQIGY